MIMIIDYSAISKFFISHDKVPLKQGCMGFNNIVLKKNIKIVAFLSYLSTKKNVITCLR